MDSLILDFLCLDEEQSLLKIPLCALKNLDASLRMDLDEDQSGSEDECDRLIAMIKQSTW